MIGPTKIGEVLNSRKDVEYTSQSFFKTHTHLEAYVKRVLLISLRLKGVQYDNSVKIVESTYINTASLIDKVLALLDSTNKKQADVLADLKIKYPEFFTCKSLVLDFSSIYRNRLAHGTISELKDTELIKLLCMTNYAFYQSFEKLLASEYSHSALEKPGVWGAKRGKAEGIEITVKSLKLGSIVKEPKSKSTVKALLKSTAYGTAL
ncbi:hypothetical protein AB6D81_24095 [Vibrio splendidus]|uniref:hypothetical protein n=1 Tax=Vibrio TaxID=662 RepID=UPI000377A9CA|nr:hypothetical protein [Vibrio splendidus]